jgi:hypothetical protein
MTTTENGAKKLQKTNDRPHKMQAAVEVSSYSPGITGR